MKSIFLKTFLFCSMFTIIPFSIASSNTQIGYGLTTCAQYEQIRSQSPVAEQVFDSWVLGYLSGVNFIIHTTKNVDLLADQDAKGISGFIKGYCSTNPSKTVTEAANEYWFKLSEQKK